MEFFVDLCCHPTGVRRHHQQHGYLEDFTFYEEKPVENREGIICVKKKTFKNIEYSELLLSSSSASWCYRGGIVGFLPRNINNNNNEEKGGRKEEKVLAVASVCADRL